MTTIEDMTGRDYLKCQRIYALVCNCIPPPTPEVSMPLSSLIYKANHITIGIGDEVLVDSHIVAYVFKLAS